MINGAGNVVVGVQDAEAEVCLYKYYFVVA